MTEVNFIGQGVLDRRGVMLGQKETYDISDIGRSIGVVDRIEGTGKNDEPVEE